MRIAVCTPAALAAALIGAAPLMASAQAARILGETDGVTPNTPATASSASPVVSPIHKKTGDLARVAREAAQAAVTAPTITPAAPTPIPAGDVADPATGTAGTAAPLGNQPADSVTIPPSAPVPGATPNHGTAFKAHARVRTLKA